MEGGARALRLESMVMMRARSTRVDSLGMCKRRGGRDGVLEHELVVCFAASGLGLCLATEALQTIGKQGQTGAGGRTCAAVMVSHRASTEPHPSAARCG